MSGHSKWSTIKRQKGVADAKRGQVFTKLANAIVLAARSGGGTDPNFNFKLRLAIDKARAANMPKENIDRAISRASAAAEGGLEEAVYEGFIPGGASVIIEAVTDKKQRTVAEIKNMLEKNGGTLGVPGSVSYLYSRIGEIIVPKNDKSSEEILNLVMDSGVDDFEEESDMVILYTDPSQLQNVKNALDEQGIAIGDAGIIYKPMALMEVTDESIKQRAIELLEKIEDHDDVQKIYTNISY
jgi:YebC/PmpR family DNA-binding regulatory protein